MTSTVQLRKPKIPSSGTSSGGRIGRPKSWTEFNTRYQSFSAPVSIDLTPVPKMEDQAVKRREGSGFRKIRPLSSSILEQPDGKLKIQNRPSSPKYTSFMAPNPWRISAPKPTIPNEAKTRKPTNQNKDVKVNYDATTHHYDEIKNVTNPQMTAYISPKAKLNFGYAQKTDKTDQFVPKFNPDSDSDSTDSAVVSGGSTPHGTSSEKSPKWRYRDSRSSSDLDTSRSNEVNSDNRTETSLTTKDRLQHQNFDTAGDDDNRSSEQSPEGPEVPVIEISAASATFSSPSVAASNTRQLVDMEFFPDDDVIRFADAPPGNYAGRSIVPSPLKSCYSSNAAYDALVEISDFENSSGEENSFSEVSRSNTSTHKGYEGDRSADEYKARPTPTAIPRQSSLLGARTNKKNGNDDVTDNDARKKHYDARSGTWPRRKARKREDSVDADKLMEEFKKSQEKHLSKFKSIYEDSRKRIDDVMQNLKRTMTENGYLEWYPKIR